MTENTKTLLLVDDDKPFLTRLGKAMEARGFEVRLADTVAVGVAEVKKMPPMFAVLICAWLMVMALMWLKLCMLPSQMPAL